MSANKEAYPECKHIKREKPDLTVSQEVAEHIGRNYRTLPIFEKGLFEHAYTKHYSLQTNEYLKCRWAEYKKHIEDRVFAPFQFLDIRDYHFYNCRNRLIPSVSIHTKTDFRKKQKPGPGVDFGGQMPIPQEHHMKRGEGNPRKLPKRYNKEGKDVKVEKTVKVAPAELESVLQQHPHVREAGVMGAPHEKYGEAPLAFVALQPGATVSEDELVAYVDTQVSARMRLEGGVRFVDALPRGAGAKLDRKALKEMI